MDGGKIENLVDRLFPCGLSKLEVVVGEILHLLSFSCLFGVFFTSHQREDCNLPRLLALTPALRSVRQGKSLESTTSKNGGVSMWTAQRRFQIDNHDVLPNGDNATVACCLNNNVRQTSCRRRPHISVLDRASTTGSRPSVDDEEMACR